MEIKETYSLVETVNQLESFPCPLHSRAAYVLDRQKSVQDLPAGFAVEHVCQHCSLHRFKLEQNESRIQCSGLE
jgi:hypothetical protein